MLNIAIDGPAGAGKSTVAKAVAKNLGIIYLDTGAMYRAMALKAVKNNINPTDKEKVISILKDTDIRIEYDNGKQDIFLDGENVTTLIRTNEISKAASDISAIKEVRIKLVELQRNIAHKNNIIMDGRDIGTNVLPDANKKFYITASAQVRAHRRYIELMEKGESIPEEKILEDIIKRDYNDMHREFAPLKQAEDAILIDTTDMSIDQVIQNVINYIGD